MSKKIDVSEMTEEQLTDLMKQLAVKITDTLDKPINKVKKILAAYDLDIVIGFEIKTLD
jgi:hypothetical protein